MCRPEDPAASTQWALLRGVVFASRLLRENAPLRWVRELERMARARHKDVDTWLACAAEQKDARDEDEGVVAINVDEGKAVVAPARSRPSPTGWAAPPAGAFSIGDALLALEKAEAALSEVAAIKAALQSGEV